MMAVRPARQGVYKEVTYSSQQWKQLKDLRKKASMIMEALEATHFKPLTHGSVARGDVKATSDVDVFIPEVQNSFLVETALEQAKISSNSRYIIQATPTYAMKAYIDIDEQTSVSFPLVQMRKVEREFYCFGGQIDLAQLKEDVRVAGVDKRLMLVEPTAKGHIESSIIGREELVAKVVGISVETILNRVHVLLKRNQVGRTGVFVKKELEKDETFEYALKRSAEQNPAVRRRWKKEV